MNADVETDRAVRRRRTFAMGLNPYGLTYHLGLQAASAPQANPQGTGLEGFDPDRDGARREGAREFRSRLRRSTTTTFARCAIGWPRSA